MEDLHKKVDELSLKIDKILLLLENKSVEPEKIWSVTDYKSSILISFPFNNDFKNFIKELGGVWMATKKAWMFPKSKEAEILDQIQTAFPLWEKK
jgi:hypothetical protein